MLEAHRAQALPTVDAATEPPTLTVRNAVQARAKLSSAQQRTLEALLPDGYIYRDPGSGRNRPYYLVSNGQLERVEVNSTVIALVKKKWLVSDDVYGLPHRPQLREWRSIYRLSDAGRVLIARA